MSGGATAGKGSDVLQVAFHNVDTNRYGSQEGILVTHTFGVNVELLSYTVDVSTGNLDVPLPPPPTPVSRSNVVQNK